MALVRKLLSYEAVRRRQGENTMSLALKRGFEGVKPLADFVVYTVAAKENAKKKK